MQLKDDPRSLFNCWNELKKVHDHCVKFKFGRITTMDISPRPSGQLKCTGNGKYLVKKKYEATGLSEGAKVTLPISMITFVQGV